MKHFLAKSVGAALPLSEPRSATTPAAQKSGADRPEFSSSVQLRRRITKRTLQHLQHVESAAAEFGRLPERDESIHSIMRGNFHGWDIVPAVLKLAAPATIRRLYVATLGFNIKNASELLELLDAHQVETVVFACSHYFAKASPREFEVLRAGLVDRGQTIVATRTHAKVLGIELTDGRCVVVESSANLRSCNNIEQLCMTESPDLFAFHAQWLDEVARQNLTQPAPLHAKPSRTCRANQKATRQPA